MSNQKNCAKPVLISLTLKDEASIDKAATQLGTTSDEIRRVIEFGHQILANGENQGLTEAQLLQSVMGVFMIALTSSGTPEEQQDRFLSLFSALLNTISLQPNSDEPLRWPDSDLTIVH